MSTIGRNFRQSKAAEGKYFSSQELAAAAEPADEPTAQLTN